MSNIIISSDKSKLDTALIHNFLTNTYWAKGRTLEQVENSIANSFCYGIYCDEEQIGFARVVSDTVVYAYIMDVFIIRGQRGNGYADQLMRFILNDSTLKDVKQWRLKTKDAHHLYEKLGFERLQDPALYLEYTT